MEQNIKMENQHVNNDKGNWCKRLRSRKGTTRCSSLEKANRTENNSVHKGEQSDRKISTPPPSKKQQNQHATDTAEHTPTPLPDNSSEVPQELKTSEEHHKASLPSATPVDASGTPPSGLSPQRPEDYEDIKHTAPPLPKSLSDPHSLNGVFTCVRCKLYTKDIGTFLQHKHNVQHEPPLSGDAKEACASQSHDLNNYLSLTSTGPPLKYEYDSQKHPQNDYAKHTAAVTRKEKERKYIWRKKEIQPKVENSTSPGLKLRLTKNPLKANSWMARGLLSLSGEGMIDENALFLTPEKTLEATNQYLERTIVSEKSGKKTMIKEELRNLSRPVTPVSLLLPKNGTSLPPESVNPSNNELAVLMEKNNISIPPNCTTKVQGFKMVDGKKHLVLKVIPPAKQEIMETVELMPCSTEGVLSNTTSECQNLDQSDPACSITQHQPCNGISAHEAISTYSPVLGETDTDCSPLEKSAHGQCEDQGFCNGPKQGCDDNYSLNHDYEDSHKTGDDQQISAQEVMKQQLSDMAPLMPVIGHAACRSPVHLLHEALLTSAREPNASVDVTDGCLSPAAEEDSSSESDGGFPISQSPPESDTLPASPCQPCEDGTEHSHTDDGIIILNVRESHVKENNADVSEVSGTAESVKTLQGSAVSVQTTCLQNSETSCCMSSPEITAQPITDLRIVQALTCTQDAVEKPDPQVLSPLRAETAVNNKRPRDSSPDLSQDRPTSKARRDEVDSEDGTGSTSTEAGCWEPSPRHVEKTLRLFPFSCFQLIKKPQGEQPVVVLNHPDADIPEVANIMTVVHKYGNEVQKVVLCQRTLKALSDFWGDGGTSPATDGTSPSPRRVPPGSTVKERFSLKLKLRRSGQNAYQVVNTGRPQSLRCWFCGRIFTNQEDFICHGQRHLMEANSDWRSGWFKSQ